MLGWLVVGGLVVVGCGVWSRWRKAGRLLSDDHFIEIAATVARVRAAALARPIAAGQEPMPDDARIGQTSLGLAVAYTVHRGDAVTHHVSISLAGDLMTHSLGTIAISYFAFLAGWPRTGTVFQIGRSNVHHAEIALTAEEHAQVVAFAPPEVTSANVATLRARALARRVPRVESRSPGT